MNGVAVSRTIDQELDDISVNKQFVQEVDQQGAPGPVVGTSPGTYNATFVAALLDQQVRYEVIRQVLVAKKALPTAADVATAKNEVSQSFSSGVLRGPLPGGPGGPAGGGAFLCRCRNGQPDHGRTQPVLPGSPEQLCDRGLCSSHTHRRPDASGQTDYQASLGGAQKVKALLDAGGDFAALAKQYSRDNTGTDGGTAAHGGTLTGSAPDGCLTVSDLQTLDRSLPAFAEAVASLPVNVVNAPVQTKLGFT